MQMDVRKTTNEKITELYQEFKKYKPEITWDDEHPYLIFKNSTGQKFTTGSIWLEYNIKDVSCSFYPNVDNIRFDGYLEFTKEIIEEIKEFIKHGTSKDPVDYLKREIAKDKPPIYYVKIEKDFSMDNYFSKTIPEITDDFCGTKKGIVYDIVSVADVPKINGRYYLDENNKLTKIDKPYSLIGSKVEVFSPLYCLKEGNKFCKICTGDMIHKQSKLVTFLNKLKSIF